MEKSLVQYEDVSSSRWRTPSVGRAGGSVESAPDFCADPVSAGRLRVHAVGAVRVHRPFDGHDVQQPLDELGQLAVLDAGGSCDGQVW